MIPEPVWLACGSATVVCLFSDLVVFAVQQAQRERFGLVVERLGLAWRFIVSLIFNFVATFLLTYLYHAVALGSGRAFYAGGIVWLSFVIPTLMTSRHLDDRKRAVLITRMLGWLFKTAVAAAAIDYFLG